jgi:hypothetical protein
MIGDGPWPPPSPDMTALESSRTPIAVRAAKDSRVRLLSVPPGATAANSCS